MRMRDFGSDAEPFGYGATLSGSTTACESLEMF